MSCAPPPARCHRHRRVARIAGPVGLAALAVAGWSAPVHAGSIDLVSDRPGQQILVDGIETGLVTPARIDGLAAGDHRVLVRGACHMGQTTVEVPAEGVVTTRLISSPAPGELQLEVTPPGATATVDGKPATVGKPVVLPCGAHSVRVALDGYLQELRQVEVEAGATARLAITLEKLGLGTLAVTVQPDKAEVLLDGTFVARGDYRSSAVTAGPHVLEVKAEGHEPRTEMFVLEAQATQSFDIALTATPGAVAAAPPAGSSRSDNKDKKTLRNTGIGVAVAGAGVGIFGLTRFAVSGQAYQDYLAASESPTGSAAEAQAIRDDEVVPARNLGVTLSSVGAALLAGGVTMAVVF